MHLRSGASITFGLQASTKASTQASGVQAKSLLSAIIEGQSSSSSDTSRQSASEASASMDSFRNLNLNNSTMNVDAVAMGYDNRLVFIRENQFGAKIYEDVHNQTAVKIEDMPTPTEAEVWVRSQGDQYMSVLGVRYLLTPEFENMDADGQLHFPPHVRTFSKPATHSTPWSTEFDSPYQAPAPSAPPAEVSWAPQRQTDAEEVSFSFPSAAPNFNDNELYRLRVLKIENDSEWVALYVSSKGIIFKTMMSYGTPYPNEQTLHVYGEEGSPSLDFRDAWGNKYYTIEGDTLQDFTKKGIPIFPSRPYAPTVEPKPASFTAGPGDPRYNAPTPRFGEFRTPTFDPAPTYGRMNATVEPVIRDPPRPPKPKGTSHGEKPKSGMGETRGSLPADAPFEINGRGKFPGPKGRGKREELGNKNIRPTTLQKFCKKFDGTGDPHEHVALFHQLIYAEGVTDVHTKVHGFGLTLSGSALSWFQTLKSNTLYDYDILVTKFIEAHTKIGIKHNTVTLILNFKQGDKETVHQSIDRIKQYIARCPDSEFPKQERLVSCFLEGLIDNDLYMLLFAQDHKDFEFCCFEAQHLDDNQKGRSATAEQGSASSSNVRRNNEVDSHNIAEQIVRLLRQENRGGQQQRPYQQTQPTPPLRDSSQGALKWCEPCRRWGNHSTNECYSKQRYMREIGAGTPQRI